MDELKGYENPLESLIMTIPFSSRDWSTEKRDAWVYGIVCGWDDDCFSEFERKFGWNKETFDRLKRLHTRFKEMRRTQSENKLTVRKECAHMQYVEGGIPYCEEKQTACNGCIGQENKPLSLEKLRLMDGLWVWIEASTWNGKHYSGWGKIIQVFPIVSVKIIEESPGYITEYDIGRHEAKFYAHKPKQEKK